MHRERRVCIFYINKCCYIYVRVQIVDSSTQRTIMEEATLAARKDGLLWEAKAGALSEKVSNLEDPGEGYHTRTRFLESAAILKSVHFFNEPFLENVQIWRILRRCRSSTKFLELAACLKMVISLLSPH